MNHRLYLLTLILGLCCFVSPPSVTASSPYILAAGQATAEGSGQEAALRQAEQKAVTQALSRMITPSADPSSIFQQITRHYPDYVAGTSKIIKTQKKDGTIVVFAQVPINYDKLRQHLTKDITSLQQAAPHVDDEAYFFIRVTGVMSAPEQMRRQAEVLNFYTDSFQQYGFQKGSADDILIETMKRHTTLSYDEYLRTMVTQIQQDAAISLAVVGEIHLEPSITDETGTNSTCTSNITVFYHNADGSLQPVGTFTDTYTLRRATQAEAEKLVLQKAAYNSAKYLSHLTLTYWEKHS